MTEHYCRIHDKEFKQTEKMRKAGRGYSHAISNADGTTSWCNEDAQEVAKLPPQPDGRMLPEHEEVVEKAKASVGEMTKGDWAEKDRVTRQSIQRQTAIKASTELAVAKVRAGKETSLNEILAVAIAFESYLESGANVEKK